MKTVSLLLLLILSLVSSLNAFVPTISQQTSITQAHRNSVSRVVVGRQTSTTVPIIQYRSSSSIRTKNSVLFMGNVASFGIFSPAVYIAKIVLGKEKLNKIRGKAISLHSQYIGDFCEWVGAYHLRTRLIKKAKLNGDKLGFLV
jgi:hypothetical protein